MKHIRKATTDDLPRIAEIIVFNYRLKFLSHNKRYYELNITQSKVMVKYYPIFQFVGKALPVCTAVLGGISVMNGEMSLQADM